MSNEKALGIIAALVGSRPDAPNAVVVGDVRSLAACAWAMREALEGTAHPSGIAALACWEARAAVQRHYRTGGT